MKEVEAMNLEQYNYELPDNLIAQTPLKDRTASKLLVLDEKGNIAHDTFRHIGNFLSANDVLVVNDTRVIPARLIGEKADTKAKIEILLLHERGENEWEVLIKPAKRVKVGTEIVFGNGRLWATCIDFAEDGKRIVRLSYEGILLEVLESLGEMPLPPYITAQLAEDERYQTVYSKHAGSAAAPTAGLHFTEALMDELKNKGVQIVPVTLHVGLGTFRPVSVDQIENHTMHSEFYEMSQKSATILNEAKANGKNIIAVGTTSTRVLETIAKANDGKFIETSGWTDIFIYPPYEFAAVDGLITNFHLPKSTLLMLISALRNREMILQTYQVAIKEQYRFFSFGDAMFILPKRNEK